MRCTSVFLRVLCITTISLSVACSFDYSALNGDESDAPDIIMTGVEFVQVRNGSLHVRIQADAASRWEDEQRMEMDRLAFEQYSSNEEVSALGAAGFANINLDSGSVSMQDGVRLHIPNEDLWIETNSLEWDDEIKILLGPDDEQVLIKREDGTLIQGTSFGADARRRAWEFAGPVSGTYYNADETEADR